MVSKVWAGFVFHACVVMNVAVIELFVINIWLCLLPVLMSSKLSATAQQDQVGVYLLQLWIVAEAVIQYTETAHLS